MKNNNNDELYLDTKFITKDVYSSNVKKMKDSLSENLNLEEMSLMEYNLDLIRKLIEFGIPISALTTLSKESYLDSIDKISKENYKFPSILNLGMLKSWQSTPSKIIGNDVFETESPLLFPIENTSIGFIQNQKYKDSITNTIEVIILKILISLPLALSRVSIIDKTGSGQNFPNLIRLSEKFTDNKIISEDLDIETELEEIKNSISAITTSITANGFSSIEEYNTKTEEIPQTYRIIAISNFPVGFSKKASESLLSILESGHKAGVFVVMTMAVDLRHGYSQPLSGLTLRDFMDKMSTFEFSDKPHEYTRKKLIKENVNLLSIPYPEENVIKETLNNSFKMIFEKSDAENFNEVITELNNKMLDISIRPVIMFDKTVPPLESFWEGRASDGISIKFAKNGIEDIYLSLGINQFGESESTYHGLIGGATGSGKTVLLHDIILHAGIKYSPDDLQLWLLDYKEGTEFAAYKNFPHVNILSMESEVEFGQEVLEKANRERVVRGNLFKKVGASNLKEYNERVSKEEQLPRILIIIDEFQALFPRNPKITAKTNDLIDQILRLGRSFGFNLLLSTQTLKGIDMDPQLMTNMPLRIGLKMDKKDINRLFDENNTAVKFLNNPGEGIYNKQYGQMTSNIHFQAYNIDKSIIDKTINLIDLKIKESFSKEEIDSMMESRFVYNGKGFGSLENNNIYMDIIKNNKKFPELEFYIGEYAGLSKEHAKFSFKREYAENLIIAGQGISRVSKLIKIISYQLVNSERDCEINIFNFNKKEEIEFNELTKLSTKIKTFTNRDFKESFTNVWDNFLKRKEMSEKELSEEKSLVNIFFFPEGSSDLNSDKYSSDSVISRLKKIMSEGPEVGIHIIFYVTTVNTLSTLELVRDLDRFKKKIGTMEGNYDKIFGDMSEEINTSISKFVMVAHSGESGSNLFKFKNYGEFKC